MTTRYRKRPVVVDAVQWTGDNEAEVQAFVGPAPSDPGAAFQKFDIYASYLLYVAANRSWLPVELGEWVIKDSKGCYPCKADIFEATYEPVEETG